MEVGVVVERASKRHGGTSLGLRFGVLVNSNNGVQRGCRWVEAISTGGTPVIRGWRSWNVRASGCVGRRGFLSWPAMDEAAAEIGEAGTGARGVSSTPLSPAMRQYQQFKAQYPNYVLFFRMGDFYEMFWDDAQLAARVLGVALTSRSKGGPDGADSIPMAGVPYHAVEAYLRKMIAAGHRVAI